MPGHTGAPGKDILNGVVENMAQCENASNIWRRNNERESWFGGSRIGEKVALFQPPGIPFLFDRVGLVGFR
jgi:hypothetical protein